MCSSDLAVPAANVQVTWINFQEAFNEKYFSSYYQSGKRKEFMLLEQGSMSVDEYVAKFTSLSRFAPWVVSIEEMMCEKFQMGLSFRIQSRVAVFQEQNFRQIISKSKIVEKELDKVDERREQFKKTKSNSQSQQKRQDGKPPRGGSYATQFSNEPNQSGQKRGSFSQQSQQSVSGKRFQGSQHSEVRCFKCKEMGHYASECPINPTICFNCGHAGHYKRDCPSSAMQVSSVGNTPMQGRGAGSAGSEQQTFRKPRVFALTDLNNQKPHDDAGGNLS